MTTREDSLNSYRCPDHGCDLVEWSEPDGDETGVWMHTYYRCESGGCTFRAEPNGAGDTYPVED